MLTSLVLQLVQTPVLETAVRFGLFQILRVFLVNQVAFLLQMTRAVRAHL